MLKDENSEVENEVVQKLELDNLHRCMKTLPAIEQDILRKLFLPLQKFGELALERFLVVGYLLLIFGAKVG